MTKKKAYALAEEIARISPAKGYLSQARILREEKKPDSPEPYYLKALEADPKDYGIYMTLVDFYLDRKSVV